MFRDTWRTTGTASKRAFYSVLVLCAVSTSGALLPLEVAFALFGVALIGFLVCSALAHREQSEQMEARFARSLDHDMQRHLQRANAAAKARADAERAAAEAEAARRAEEERLSQIAKRLSPAAPVESLAKTLTRNRA